MLSQADLSLITLVVTMVSDSVSTLYASADYSRSFIERGKAIEEAIERKEPSPEFSLEGKGEL